jgi:predicted transcriptional regulator
VRFSSIGAVDRGWPGERRVDGIIYTPYRCRMAETTTIRISRDTHARVTRLAAERHETIDELVSSALRALRQDDMGRDLSEELTQDETAWLDADAG